MQRIGQTTCIGIGADLIIGTSFIDCLDAFERDPDTNGIVMVGEIGGRAEEEVAEFISKNMKKKLLALLQV